MVEPSASTPSLSAQRAGTNKRTNVESDDSLKSLMVAAPFPSVRPFDTRQSRAHR